MVLAMIQLKLSSKDLFRFPLSGFNYPVKFGQFLISQRLRIVGPLDFFEYLQGYLARVAGFTAIPFLPEQRGEAEVADMIPGMLLG